MLNKTVLVVSRTTQREKTGASIQLARKTYDSPVEAPTYEYFDPAANAWALPPSQDGAKEGEMRAVLYKIDAARIEFWLQGKWVRFVGITDVLNAPTGKPWDGNQYF
jgi:hypothetical protein